MNNHRKPTSIKTIKCQFVLMTSLPSSIANVSTLKKKNNRVCIYSGGLKNKATKRVHFKSVRSAASVLRHFIQKQALFYYSFGHQWVVSSGEAEAKTTTTKQPWLCCKVITNVWPTFVYYSAAVRKHHLPVRSFTLCKISFWRCWSDISDDSFIAKWKIKWNFQTIYHYTIYFKRMFCASLISD